MHISLTPELERAVLAKVESGLYSDASDVLREAVCCLLLREHTESSAYLHWGTGEPWTPETLQAAVAVGAEQAERGEFSQRSIPDIIAELEKRHS